MAKKPFIPKPGQISSFELYGERQGKKIIIDGKVMPNFPKEVALCGMIYTLLRVEKQRDDRELGLPIDHPGYWVEHGIYG